jgi:hypothetical protein
MKGKSGRLCIQGKTVLPWMRMINEFGGGWNTAKRCEAIADRLELFRKDGLVALDFRSDPKTPNQYVICLVVQRSPGKVTEYRG